MLYSLIKISLDIKKTPLVTATQTNIHIFNDF